MSLFFVSCPCVLFDSRFVVVVVCSFLLAVVGFNVVLFFVLLIVLEFLCFGFVCVILFCFGLFCLCFLCFAGIVLSYRLLLTLLLHVTAILSF